MIYLIGPSGAGRIAVAGARATPQVELLPGLACCRRQRPTQRRRRGDYCNPRRRLSCLGRKVGRLLWVRRSSATPLGGPGSWRTSVAPRACWWPPTPTTTPTCRAPSSDACGAGRPSSWSCSWTHSTSRGGLASTSGRVCWSCRGQQGVLRLS